MGPADLLAGVFQISGSNAFTNSGFGGFAGLAAGSSIAIGSVTLGTGTAGLLQETLTFNPTGSNASGYSAALAPETLTITADVAQQLAGQMKLTAATEGVALANQTVATFTDTNTNDVATGFTASINWGDGSTTSGTVTGANGTFAVAGSHTYADEGNEPLSVTITDTANSTQLPLSANVVVAEGDVLTPHGTTISSTASQTFSGTVATFSDSDTTSVPSDFAARINTTES
jgi:hypothetical protein